MKINPFSFKLHQQKDFARLLTSLYVNYIFKNISSPGSCLYCTYLVDSVEFIEWTDCLLGSLALMWWMTTTTMIWLNEDDCSERKIRICTIHISVRIKYLRVCCKTNKTKIANHFSLISHVYMACIIHFV